MGADGGDVVGGTGLYRRGSDGEPGGVGDDLDFPVEALVLTRAPGLIAGLGTFGQSVGGLGQPVIAAQDCYTGNVPESAQNELGPGARRAGLLEGPGMVVLAVAVQQTGEPVQAFDR